MLEDLPSALQLDPAEYRALIERIGEAAESSAPPGAAILIVSRGDEKLVDVHGRRGWHFPLHDDGKYAGHYPSHSGAAVSHLEELKMKGADYLLFPATAFWWFQHYPEFAHHLKTRYRTVVQIDDTCLIFALREVAGSSLPGFLDSVLPLDAAVVVVSSGDESLRRLGDRRVWHFPHTENGAFDHRCAEEEALVRLRGVIKSGAEYLVLPSVGSSWLDLHPGFRDAVERRYRSFLHRDRLCAVFDLGEPLSEPDEAADLEQETAHNTLLSRLSEMWPRARRREPVVAGSGSRRQGDA